MGTWIRYDAFRIPTKDVLGTVGSDEILPMRQLRKGTDDSTRGDRDYEEHPLKAHPRSIVQ